MKQSILSKWLFFLSFYTSIGAHPSYAQSVSIYDQGLNMKISTYTLPQAWQVDHRIVTTTSDYTRFFSFYKFDFLGSGGEVIRNFAPVKFSPYLGESVEKIWHRTIVQQIEPFGRFEGGQLTQSYYGKYLFPQLANYPGIQLVESNISGYRNGKAFEGVCIGFLAYGNYASQLTGIIIISAKGKLNATLEKYRQINQSKRENTAYTHRINQINQQKNQQYVNYSQRIMSNRQAQFDSWQKSHQAAVNAYSQSSAAFRAHLRGSSATSSASSNGPFSTQDARNNHIQGVTSFDDAYLGYRVKKSGEFDYWYTDGYGSYHGTNDAGFDPATLGSNWHRAYPVGN